MDTVDPPPKRQTQTGESSEEIKVTSDVGPSLQRTNRNFTRSASESDKNDSFKGINNNGLDEDEVLDIVEGLRERWVREDELTYASQIDFDAAQTQI